jgi:hypothetical protein
MVSRLQAKSRKHDIDIDELLRALRFRDGLIGKRARRHLEELGLTRPGKSRIAITKVDRVRQELGSKFSFWCGSRHCESRLPAHAERVSCEPSECDICGGSDNRRAGLELADALRMTNKKRIRLLVVGGSPGAARDLERARARNVEIRMIYGDRPRAPGTVMQDIGWADRMCVWASTEIAHKVSIPYQNAARANGLTTHVVARRGAAALLTAVADSLVNEKDGSAA